MLVKLTWTPLESTGTAARNHSWEIRMQLEGEGI